MKMTALFLLFLLFITAHAEESDIHKKDAELNKQIQKSLKEDEKALRLLEQLSRSICHNMEKQQNNNIDAESSDTLNITHEVKIFERPKSGTVTTLTSIVITDYPSDISDKDSNEMVRIKYKEDTSDNQKSGYIKASDIQNMQRKNISTSCQDN